MFENIFESIYIFLFLYLISGCYYSNSFLIYRSSNEQKFCWVVRGEWAICSRWWWWRLKLHKCKLNWRCIISFIKSLFNKTTLSCNYSCGWLLLFAVHIFYTLPFILYNLVLLLFLNFLNICIFKEKNCYPLTFFHKYFISVMTCFVFFIIHQEPMARFNIVISVSIEISLPTLH